MKNPPMRMLILLAVFWGAGSLLLAAESPTTPKPAATAKQSAGGAKADTKTDTKDASQAGADKSGATRAASKDDGKDSAQGSAKPSIAEQAEAALKAASEDDASGTAKEPPKSEAQNAGPAAKDDTQLPPSGSSGKGPSPQRFVPSEQVRADFDVSFPIDI